MQMLCNNRVYCASLYLVSSKSTKAKLDKFELLNENSKTSLPRKFRQIIVCTKANTHLRIFNSRLNQNVKYYMNSVSLKNRYHFHSTNSNKIMNIF